MRCSVHTIIAVIALLLFHFTCVSSERGARSWFRAIQIGTKIGKTEAQAADRRATKDAMKNTPNTKNQIRIQQNTSDQLMSKAPIVGILVLVVIILHH